MLLGNFWVILRSRAHQIRHLNYLSRPPLCTKWFLILAHGQRKLIIGQFFFFEEGCYYKKENSYIRSKLTNLIYAIVLDVLRSFTLGRILVVS